MTCLLPNPIHQSIYFSLVGAMSLGSESRPRVARGDGLGGGWGAGLGGGRERRKRASHPVNRAYTHKILQFSYSLQGNEPIRGSHSSSFLHILPLKQYNGCISIKSIKNENYSILNACGLAIFSNFYLHWFFSNLSFVERDPHMDSPEGIRVNGPNSKNFPTLFIKKKNHLAILSF